MSAIPEFNEEPTVPQAVIVGSVDDAHVVEVLRHLPQEQVLILDVDSLSTSGYVLDADGLLIAPHGSGRTFKVAPNKPIRGWIRRLASPEWQRGVVLESREAAEKTSWLTLLSAISRSLGVDWLTPLDTLVARENKIVQYATVAGLGVRVPRTVVTSEPDRAAASFDGDVVIKPVGPGHFYEPDGEAKVVFATMVTADRLAGLPLSSAPFLIQERLTAARHYRVVTVADRVWAGVLDAEGLPLDWRSDEAAHGSFESCEVPVALAQQASLVAKAAGVGYSSQDWVETTEGFVFLDLNPSGQWLFLPPETADAITVEIASHLLAGER